MEMKLRQLVLAGALLGAGAIGVAKPAHALDVIPQWTTNQVSELTATDVETLTGYTGDGLSLVYSQAYLGAESGAGAPYYTTSFSLDAQSEPTGGAIVWGGPLWIGCPTCYLVVQDGPGGDPAQYVFNLGSWDGQETINLSGFWVGTPGAIASVRIFNEVGVVPETDTYAMLLAGLALVGFAARRKLRKEV